MNGKQAKKIRKKAMALVDEKLVKHPTRRSLAPLIYKKAVKLLKSGIITICIIMISGICHADKLGICTVNPQKFQELMAEKGYKVDLAVIEKTKESWGFLTFDNMGMCIQTYKPVNTDIDLPIVTEIMWSSMEE